MPQSPTIVWFRQDLRLDDNAALAEAAARGAVIPVFIWAPEDEGEWPPGAASRWWLHQSLSRLDESLRRMDSRLIIRRGPAWEQLQQLAAETAAGGVYWNRRYEPAAIARDGRVNRELNNGSCEARSLNSALLFEPWEVQTQAGEPYQVFTAFWKACQRLPKPESPQPPPQRLRAPKNWPSSLALSALQLEPRTGWAAGIRANWTPGEDGARTSLARFLKAPLRGYAQDRDRPALRGTSRLSPHLHFGEISPRRVWHEAARRKPAQAAEPFLRQLGWREFAYHLLFHFPHTPGRPLREKFQRFPWSDDPLALQAWQKGRTGYPIVDAGMRELWRTGWMHNRVRMITASFLTKHLLLPWQQGARWFWDTLADADLANNTLGWQWTAGCGADAAPYFRIFHPVLQGEKFDPQGDYVKRWVPELGKLPPKWIHRPWEAPAGVLADAGVNGERSYPAPIVDHAEARGRALAAYERVRGK